MVERRAQRKKSHGGPRGDAKGVGRYFWGVAVLAAVCLCLVAALWRRGDGHSLSVVWVNDTRDLLTGLHLAKEVRNVTTISHVTDCMMRVGLTLESTLVSAADKATAIAAERDVTNTAETYRMATDFILETLSPLLQKKSWDAAVQEYHAEPKFIWRWIAVATYALTAALPEYFLALDKTGTHGEALVAGLQLLLYASNAAASASPLFAPVAHMPLVECAHYEKSSRWKKFCGSGFSNLSGLEVRRAAILEELIALHPDYAPLRLHYAVALSMSRQAAKSVVVLEVLERERSKLHTRTHVDPLHGAVLGLCEAFRSLVGKKERAETAVRVLEGLRQIDTCARLLRPFHSNLGSWRHRFSGQERPDVMDRRQARRLLDAMTEILKENRMLESLPAGLRACGETD
ncbi:hypothetical protein TraAM80_03864 [Trypanosoma rangeli]|uniref:Uncharacterized protein n=1 Tax=Trypanosoma rangeli TaxID=5698 RepID=A0A3R7L316_TRYRA|nr:uncharacterized protein TraAM80_03864 [Trypanosoma rangeli]RNF06594.1 hypothetical protein TraAM80_03864 [Trypanosoma rangeli]|eukprot:RNF06594.1 hypothetical protein TraAM80_03864 [Trypanosoma rangeli]